MAHRAIPMIAFHVYSYVTYTLYTLIRKLRHSGELGQLMGIARKRTCVTAELTDQDEINLWKLQLIAVVCCKMYSRTLKSNKNEKTSTVGCLESLFENS